MPYPSAGHPHHQTPNIPSRPSLPISILRRLIHELIESRVHIVRKLNFRYRLHSLRRGSNRKTHYTLFAQWCIEDSFPSKFRSQTRAAPEDATESDILAEQEDGVVDAERVCEGGVDGLVEVLAGIGGIRREVWYRCTEAGGAVVEERGRGIVDRDVEAGVGGVGRGGASRSLEAAEELLGA